MANFAAQIGGLDPDGNAPLYLRLQRSLRQAIQKGVLSPDDALPAERDLAEEFNISRITVRKALSALVDEGLLTRRQGAGTFIASRVEKQFSKLSSFTEDMLSRGRIPHTEWLSKSLGKVTPEESMTLGLSPGASVYRFNRIRFADSMPMALESSTMPAFCLASVDVVKESLYEALEASGFRPTRALQRLRAVLFTPEQAELLRIKPRDPGLLIERRGFIPDGRTVEITHSYYRGDAYDFVSELNAQS